MSPRMVSRRMVPGKHGRCLTRAALHCVLHLETEGSGYSLKISQFLDARDMEYDIGNA